MASEKTAEDHKLYPVPQGFPKGSHVSSKEQYETLYKESIENPDKFWEKQAKEDLHWFKPFTTVRAGGFHDGDIAWFLDGELNVSYNCLDRHVLNGKGDRVAIIWEGETAADVRKITYAELLKEVCRISNGLINLGLRKGDTVAIYLPNCIEAAASMLACARIGVVHSVVFAGFSAESLRDRINDASSKVVITADEGLRAGKAIPLKKIVDQALTECSTVTKVVVLKKTGNWIPFNEPRDVWYNDFTAAQRPYCPATPLNSEDVLFLLYTSGSTGKPKGVVHTQAGYLLLASMTHRYVFDYKENDIYACVADVGWITGHSYIVYGPLANCATTFMFESVPTFPDAGRYWDMVERHKITQFYTAPTAIRALMKFGSDPVKKYNRSSLRVLGTVGEPINPEAWRWYNEVVGEGKAAIVDTYWQTESGAHLLTPLPGAHQTKSGAAAFPFFGIKFEILDPHTGKILEGNDVTGVGVISAPWPSIARSVFNDHSRYLSTYMRVFKGYYFTGDGVTRDHDGYYWINGRVDDVINVSGHRLGTAEIESALVSHHACAEAAVVGVPHEVTGQAIFAYCILREYKTDTEELRQELKNEVRKRIGAFATPQTILIIPSLPKTRSGKIMRRLLRKIASKETKPEQLGDISTLADESVVATIVEKMYAMEKKH